LAIAVSHSGPGWSQNRLVAQRFEKDAVNNRVGSHACEWKWWLRVTLGSGCSAAPAGRCSPPESRTAPTRKGTDETAGHSEIRAPTASHAVHKIGLPLVITRKKRRRRPARGPVRPEPEHRASEACSQGDPYQPDSVSALVDHVHEDLNHGYSVWHVSRRDRDRLNHAESQLRNFSMEWRKGKFDKGNLDDAISDTQHILDRNHLSGAERDALWSDVEQLRKMREAYDRHEIGRW